MERYAILVMVVASCLYFAQGSFATDGSHTSASSSESNVDTSNASASKSKTLSQTGSAIKTNKANKNLGKANNPDATHPASEDNKRLEKGADTHGH